jgi:hypothetical protein
MYVNVNRSSTFHTSFSFHQNPLILAPVYGYPGDVDRYCVDCGRRFKIHQKPLVISLLYLELCPHIVDAVDRRAEEVNLCYRGSVRFQSTLIDGVDHVWTGHSLIH